MEDMKDVFRKLAKTITKTSGDIIQSTKNNVTISNLEMNRKDIYEEIGKKVYEIYEFGGSLGEPFDELYKEAKKVNGELEKLKSSLEKEKDLIPCSTCHQKIPKKSQFCPFCGKEQNIIIKKENDTHISIEKEIENKSNPSPEKEKTLKVCPVCHTENDPKELFCTHCGRTL